MITASKGTNDILPAGFGPEEDGIFVSELWRVTERHVAEVADDYGYREIRTPMFEATELFARGLGDGSDVVRKEMFSFSDRGERELTLRPEGTASVVRSYVENAIGRRESVARLWYQGPMFRAERPQKGRYRQFHQFGVECIGGATAGHDVEVTALFWTVLSRLGLARMRLKVNSVGCPACRPAYQEALRTYFADKKDTMCEDCRDRYGKNTLRMLDCKREADQAAIAGAPAAVDHLCPECAAAWDQYRDGLRNLHIPYDEDRRLVRGLDYYTRTAFEITHDGLGAQSTIVGGGRYDLLVNEFGGGNVPAVGAAFGYERLLLALQAEGLAGTGGQRPAFFLVLLDQAEEAAMQRLLYELRRRGVGALSADGSRQVGKQFKAADKSGAHYAVFVGGEEWAAGKLVVKDLGTETQRELPFAGTDAVDVLLPLAAEVGHGE